MTLTYSNSISFLTIWTSRQVGTASKWFLLGTVRPNLSVMSKSLGDKPNGSSQWKQWTNWATTCLTVTRPNWIPAHPLRPEWYELKAMTPKVYIAIDKSLWIKHVTIIWPNLRISPDSPSIYYDSCLLLYVIAANQSIVTSLRHSRGASKGPAGWV